MMMDYPNPLKRPGATYPDRVTLESDGVYRWAYSLNVEESKYVRTVVLLTVGGICVFLLLFAAIIGMDSTEMVAMLLTCAIAMVIALGICAFVRQPGYIKKYYEMTEQYVMQVNPKDRFRVDFTEVRKAIVKPNRITLYRRVIRMDVRIPAEDYSTVKFHILSRLGPGTEIIYQ